MHGDAPYAVIKAAVEVPQLDRRLVPGGKDQTSIGPALIVDAANYFLLGSGRLVIAGAPGSGKSGAAVLLVQTCLKCKRQVRMTKPMEPGLPADIPRS
jgi:hypothetical protein